MRCSETKLCRVKADQKLLSLKEGEYFMFDSRPKNTYPYEKYVYRWTSDQIAHRRTILHLKEDIQWMRHEILSGNTVLTMLLEERQDWLRRAEDKIRYFVP
ncbi:predicted ORF [Xanthomonas phage XacN1]|nr:predicted ORF [Xanthomonas phage XacN1]